MKKLALLAAGLAFFAIGHAAQPQATSPGFELVLVDLQGQKKVLGAVSPDTFAPRVSPDGTRVAFEQTDAATADLPEMTRLYVAKLGELDERIPMEITVIARRNLGPVWSTDSDWLAFIATGNGADALFYQRSDGWIQPKYLVDAAAVEGWTKSGLITFVTRAGERDHGISTVDIHTREVSRLIDQPGSGQFSSEISSDGRWIAYTSNETGRNEVWLEPLPVTGTRFQLTRQGGSHPQWTPDGTKLYFDQGGRIHRVDLTMGTEPRASEPVALPITGFQQSGIQRQYDLTPDGNGFVMLFPAAR